MPFSDEPESGIVVCTAGAPDVPGSQLRSSPMASKHGVCGGCGTPLDTPAAVLLGRGERPTLEICRRCMHRGARVELVDADADTVPIDVEPPPWWRAYVAPLLAFMSSALAWCAGR